MGADRALTSCRGRFASLNPANTFSMPLSLSLIRISHLLQQIIDIINSLQSPGHQSFEPSNRNNGRASNSILPGHAGSGARVSGWPRTVHSVPRVLGQGGLNDALVVVAKPPNDGLSLKMRSGKKTTRVDVPREKKETQQVLLISIDQSRLTSINYCPPS